jgi:hypothetical protein
VVTCTVTGSGRPPKPVGCVNSIACAKTADLQAEPTLRTPHAVEAGTVGKVLVDITT